MGCVTLAWAWLAPRLPRPLRLTVLGCLAGLAVLALAVTALIPHDYVPGDLTEYVQGLVALVIELLLALAGLIAALMAVGRRRVLSAGLCGVGLYAAGVGLFCTGCWVECLLVQGPCLVLIGSALTVAAAGRLAGLPRWVARALGLGAGVAVALAVEALRGMGSRGSGPAGASHEVLSVVAIGAVLLLLGGVYMLRTQGRVLAGPFSRAAIALAGTGLVLVLRGPRRVGTGA